jgi:hypothetical protein
LVAFDKSAANTSEIQTNLKETEKGKKMNRKNDKADAQKMGWFIPLGTL